MNLKNIYIFVGLVLTAVLAVVLILPFFNTGIITSITPAEATITVEGKEYTNNQQIKLKGGEYQGELNMYGYKPETVRFRVGNYGLKKQEFKMTKPYDALIDNLPRFISFQNGFIKVSGEYSENGEPVYTVNAFNVNKEEAFRWLNINGVKTNNHQVEFIIDGD